MRIVGGALRGRRFAGPPGTGTRPMSDRVREALASALASRGAFEDAKVLDLFAGTGALAFESLSRGAARAALVERDRRVARTIEESAQTLGLSDRARIVHGMDLLGPAETVAAKLAAFPEAPFSLVFVAPPYKDVGATVPLVRALTGSGALAPEGWVVFEHPTRTALQVPDGLAEEARYRYGDTSILLLRASTV